MRACINITFPFAGPRAAVCTPAQRCLQQPSTRHAACSTRSTHALLHPCFLIPKGSAFREMFSGRVEGACPPAWCTAGTCPARLAASPLSACSCTCACRGRAAPHSCRGRPADSMQCHTWWTGSGRRRGSWERCKGGAAKKQINSTCVHTRAAEREVPTGVYRIPLGCRRARAAALHTTPHYLATRNKSSRPDVTYKPSPRT